MSSTVIGLFDEREDAESAVRALVQESFPREEISLVAHEAHHTAQMRPAVSRESESDNQAAKGAGIGAGTGAVLGGIGGLLVGLGTLAIPGLGPLVAAGPIAATLAGAGIGAVTGGLIGALAGLGVPHHEAEYYAEGVRRGGILITVNTETQRADRAADILRRFGAVDIKKRASDWQQRGWSGYDASAAPYSPEEARRERALNRGVPTPEPAIAHQATAEREEARPSQASSIEGGRPIVEANEPILTQPFTSDTPIAGTPSASSATARPFEDYEAEFRKDFETTLSNRGLTYDHHLPAYRYGYLLATDPQYAGKDWNALEPEAQAYWEERNPNTWIQFRQAIYYAWMKATGKE